MVKIRVSHKFLKRIVELDIPEDLFIKAEKGYSSAIYKIFKMYFAKCNYSRKKVQAQSIIFQRIDSNFKTVKSQSFARRSDDFSACEKENCSFCEAGKYKECPNNRRKL